jgi:hypothetical protein
MWYILCISFSSWRKIQYNLWHIRGSFIFSCESLVSFLLWFCFFIVLRHFASLSLEGTSRYAELTGRWDIRNSVTSILKGNRTVWCWVTKILVQNNFMVFDIKIYYLIQFVINGTVFCVPCSVGRYLLLLLISGNILSNWVLSQHVRCNEYYTYTIYWE